eukprot:2747716-Pyramimonas_sp.AAC.2
MSASVAAPPTPGGAGRNRAGPLAPPSPGSGVLPPRALVGVLDFPSGGVPLALRLPVSVGPCVPLVSPRAPRLPCTPRRV